jgi:hypothetical protein
LKNIKYPLFVIISGISLGTFLWVSSANFLNLSQSGETRFLWAAPSKLSLLKYVLFSLVGYLCFWLIYSFLLSVLKKDKMQNILREDAYTYLPSLFLLFPLLQFNLGLIHFSNFLVFVGQNLRTPLFGVVLAGILFLKFSQLRDLASKVQLLGAIKNKLTNVTQRQIKITVFIVSLIIFIISRSNFIAFNAPENERYHFLTGDEPNYLLITHSLAFDRDFNLYNNVKNGDGRYFYDRIVTGYSGGYDFFSGYARGDLRTKNKDYWKEKGYPFHSIGLPLLLSPAYFIGFHWDLRIRLSVVLFLNLIAALLAVNLYSLGYEVSRNKFVALSSWFFVAFSAPILFYSLQIYPELPAALLIIFAFRKIRNYVKDNLPHAFLIGLSIAYLPWFHQKFILFSGIFLFFFLFQAKYTKKSLLVFFLPIVISLVLQMWYYYLRFGVPWPVNMLHFSWSTALRQGILGLSFDRDHGLLFYSPIYIFALVGLAGLLRNKRKELFWLILPLSSYYLVTAFFRGWEGGFCPPTRYLVPILPLLVIPLAYALANVKIKSFRWAYLIMGILGIWVACHGMRYPVLLYRHRHPLISYVDSVDLARHFPNFFRLNETAYSLVLVWIGAIGIFSLYYSRLFWRDNLEDTHQKYFKSVMKFISSLLIIPLALFTLCEHLPGNKAKPVLSNKSKLKFLNQIGKKVQFIFIRNKEFQKFPPKLEIIYEAEKLHSQIRGWVKDEEAKNKRAKFADKEKNRPGYLACGQYDLLPRGKYRADFILKTSDNATSEEIVIIDIVKNLGQTTIARKAIAGRGFSLKNRYQVFSLDFNLPSETPKMEYRVFFTAKANLWVDRIAVIPLLFKN